MASVEENVKFTVVGDYVGKTFFVSYGTNCFYPCSSPTVCDNFKEKITVDGTEYNMTFCNTSGAKDYDRLRHTWYPNTDCFLVCFSVAPSSRSYYNVIDRWVSKVRHYSPLTPIILVGLQIDLREDPTAECFTTQDGEELKNKVKAHGYVECSAKTGEGLDEVLIEAIRIYKNITIKSLKRNNCILV